ncbi:RodZ domain-containing protein [Rheinheimera sp. MM224]|uniref:RodZ domain-containing protein n=1 Tax=Rheinheimera sp. MM224 TaxID=3019969 RepID=UPI0021F83D05|nr:RodZ domain-containing protein [Rheinheimera sp. MM224]CAI3803516.1 Cytoskeleton protein RodZ [Rheinheimera sp. MM224]
MTTELTQPSSAPTALSAGQILRQAREQQNLTVAQVAQQLNLGKSLIDDLEMDQVDAKLSSTFVRGYLRSYAKLLKIPAQQVLDAYSSNSKGLHQVPSLTRSFSKRTAKEATENRFMWVTYFVIAVFVVLLVLGFWQSRFGGSASGSALPMAQTDETMLASEEAKPVETQSYQPTEQPQTQQNSIPVTQLDHSPTATDTPALTTAPQTSLNADVPTVIPSQSQAIVTQPAATVPQTTTDSNSATTNADAVTLPVQSEPQLQQSIPAVTTPVQNESQTSVPVTNDVPVVATADTATDQPTTQTESSATETQTAAAVDASANATINLSLNAECWVDVVDATGKRLVFGSRQAGEQLNLRGVAPVKVLLGNAAAATLSFNGEAIDLSGYPTGRVARLTLGQN